LKYSSTTSKSNKNCNSDQIQGIRPIAKHFKLFTKHSLL